MYYIIESIYILERDSLPYILMLLPLYAVYRGTLPAAAQAHRLGEKYNGREEFISLSFYFYLTALLVQIFIMHPSVSVLQLVPFRTIISDMSYLSGNEYQRENFINNFFGNIILFIPFGFFVQRRFRLTIPGTAAVCALFSLSLEAGQLILPRNSDVDDIILNTLGGALGAVPTALFQRRQGSGKKKGSVPATGPGK